MKKLSLLKSLLLSMSALLLLSACSGTAPKLGVQNGQLLPCPDSPNCVVSTGTSEEHAIEPLNVAGSAEQAKAKLVSYLQTVDAAKVVENTDDYIRVEYTSSLMGFVDDVEFYLQAADSDKTVIQVRSASRLGYSDMGVNRERVETIRAQL